jgi:hypothetical protein
MDGSFPSSFSRSGLNDHRGSLAGRLKKRPYGPSQAIPSPRDRDDQLRVGRVIAEGPTENRHAVDQAVLGNEHILPDSVDQFFFGDRGVRTSGQINQDVEGLRGDRYDIAVPPDLAR